MTSPTSFLTTPKNNDLFVQPGKIPDLEVHDLFTLEYVQKLLKNEEKHRKNMRLSPKKNILAQQYRYQSEVEKALQLPFSQRTAKIIKMTKNFLRDLECFSIQKNSYKGEKTSQTTISKTQQNQIIKREIESLISVFAMYSQISNYEKGQIIDATGWKRQKVRILIKGQIGLFEPINRTSLTNCIQKNKQKQSQHFLNVCVSYNKLVIKIANSDYFPKIKFLESCKPKDLQFQGNFKVEIDQFFIFEMLKSSSEQNLNAEQCQQILNICEIASPITPHKAISIISNQGYFLSNQSKSSILNQPLDLETHFTAICISSEVTLIELDFAIYREILWLIKNDEEKLYISCLMRKFESLEYFEAQKYLKKKENIIDYIGQKKNSNKTETQRIDQNQCNQKYSRDDQSLTLEGRKQSFIVNKLEFLQNQSSSLYFTISYTKTPYLIVEGQVIIVINKVKQQKLIDEKYSLPRKVYTRHQILRLYQNDVFGVEAIGEEPQYCLRYNVRKDSKILKMNNKILKQQISAISGFQQEFNSIKIHRDRLIKEILNNYAYQIQKQLVKKYAEHSNQKEKKNEENIPSKKEIVHFEKEEYDHGTDLSNQKALQRSLEDTDSALNKIRTHSFSLPNIGKKLDTQAISQISSKSKLIPVTERKKQHQISPYSSKIEEVEYIGSREYPDLRKQLLEKLSLKERKKYSAHHSKRLTVQLLKEFSLVRFSEQTKEIKSEKNAKYGFVEMRDPKTGVLLRRRSIPSIQAIQKSKNRQKIEAAIMKKIGLLSEAQKVKHNEKVVKSRKSGIEFENQDEIKRKEEKRLVKFCKSLPKLENFYSKKADIQYRNKNIKKMMS